MSQYFLQKLSKFYEHDDSLAEAVIELCDDLREFPAGTHFARQDSGYSRVYLIDNGWVLRSKTLETGSRQIVSVALPGDFIGLNALLFTKSDFDLFAKTAVKAFHCDIDRLLGLIGRFPSFAAALFWVDAHEENILAERVVSLGARSARERTAHVLCEFVTRMEIVGVKDFTTILFPISQNDFSDILGMSLVHMNKTLRSLENGGIIAFRNEILTINDMDGLKAVAGFDSGYLHFTDRKDRISPKMNV
jgi:CRP-like cAMP-binding protein